MLGFIKEIIYLCSEFKNKNMKNIIVESFILIIGLILSYISFNHIDAWIGFLLAIVTIVSFLWHIFKRLNN